MTVFKYPLEARNGRLVLTEDYPEKVRQSIISAVKTYNGERVMRAAYGINSRPFSSLFVPDVLADIRQAIATGLEGYTGVQFELSGSLDAGSLAVQIYYFAPDLQPATVTLSLPL